MKDFTKKQMNDYVNSLVLRTELPVIKQALDDELATHSFLFDAIIWTQWRKIELD